MHTPLLITAALVLTTMALTACTDREATAVTTDQGAPRALPQPAPSAEQTRPLKAGDRVPAAEVIALDGRELDVSRLVAKQRTIIIFYRGGWCPYCNAHLGALSTIEPDLIKLGYQVLAISADRPSKAQETHDKFGSHYELLSDSKMEAARAFGIAFRVDDATFQRYLGFGTNLEEASGETHHLLPMPSVFVVGTDGVIRFAYSNPDYKVRLAPEDVLAAARRALE